MGVSDMTLMLYLVTASNFSFGLCDPSGDNVGVVVIVAVLMVTASVLGTVGSRLYFLRL